jgi:uncharacterized protein involved in exopolysaccharide biosynthesis
MDDEIDLQRYVRGILRYWWLILGVTVVAAVVAAAISLGQKPAYEAVALISVSTPRYNLQPDSGSPNSPLPVKAYPELAMSDDVLSEVLSRSQALLPGADPASALMDLKQQLTAEPASDPTLVRLIAQSSDAQQAADLVNIWATVFAARAGALYGQDQANLQLYTGQLAQAKTALDKSESDLAAFQATNQINILSSQLRSQQDSLTDYLNRHHELELLSRDARDLVDHLKALPASDPANSVDDLALLAITGRIYGTDNTLTDTHQLSAGWPVDIQLSTSRPMVGAAVADQLALASSLQATIGARLTDLDGQVTALQPQILALQGQVAAEQLKQDELNDIHVLASSQYTKLANQVQDATLVAQASSNTVQIASRAVLPGAKVNSRKTTTILLAAAVGLVLGSVLALALSLLRPAAQPGAPA